MKNKKHDKILNNFEQEKRKHLTYLANKLLKQDELNQKLKTKTIDINVIKDL